MSFERLLYCFKCQTKKLFSVYWNGQEVTYACLACKGRVTRSATAQELEDEIIELEETDQGDEDDQC